MLMCNFFFGGGEELVDFGRMFREVAIVRLALYVIVVLLLEYLVDVFFLRDAVEEGEDV